ncbi:MAG: DUF4433 domain-containing protein [Treponemataceae bacterium]|nr:DUF4433 domain-containing protein [Treponemataceae bacterium]
MGSKDGKLLYHLTSLSNLESILNGCLACRNNLVGVQIDDVADHDIIDKRNERFDLGKYVPFHFFMNSPFDGAVFLDSNNIGKEFVYICVKRELARSKGWKIIPRHPLNGEVVEIEDYESGFVKIRWELIDSQERNYGDRETKEACMAECIAESKVEVNDFFVIKCPSETIKRKVDELKRKYNIESFFTDKTTFTSIYYEGRIND